jgi:hypothetical protein
LVKTDNRAGIKFVLSLNYWLVEAAVCYQIEFEYRKSEFLIKGRFQVPSAKSAA